MYNGHVITKPSIESRLLYRVHLDRVKAIKLSIASTAIKAGNSRSKLDKMKINTQNPL